jgi:hypothetical protein
VTSDVFASFAESFAIFAVSDFDLSHHLKIKVLNRKVRKGRKGA